MITRKKHTFKKTRKTHKQRTQYQGSRHSNTHPPEYPYYRNEYKLNPEKIQLMASRLHSQLKIYSHPPYNEYPAYRNKHGHINSIKPFKFNHSNKYYIITSRWDDNLELNSLTDYFTEPCRVKCVFKNRQSPLDYWNKHYKQLHRELQRQLQHVIKRRGDDKDDKDGGKDDTDSDTRMKPLGYYYREEMYKRNKPCNNFRISVCLEVLRIFKPRAWLDISAGWGDRLLSALLSPTVEIYTACDPNPCLHPYYQEMINTFSKDGNGKEKNKRITMIQDGFETAQLPADVKYDLVFSSPPFFDLETYSSAASNSLIKYNTSQKWFNGFLMPAIRKAIDYLSSGGYLVLYMGESQNTEYIPEMIKLTDKMDGMRNAGVFYYTDGGKLGGHGKDAKLREFYCWQKINGK